MKRSIRRWLALAIVPTALALFGAVAPAQAASYDCDGGPNPVPSSTTGSIEITVQSGDCTIGYDVTADSSITINVLNGSLDAQKLTSKESGVNINTRLGSVKTKDLTAGTFIQVQAGLLASATIGEIEIQGPLTINATQMQDDLQGFHGNVLLQARGNIRTMDLSTGGNFPGGGKKTGGIQIDAHVFAGANDQIPLFTIGADTANGVNGIISTETVTGGGFSGTGTILGGVRITNGGPGAIGDIKVENMDKIKVQASASRSGWIQLNAQDGTLTLPTNKLNADGMNGNMAGAIFLAAKTIETEDGTVISASQDEGVSGSIHQVVIAAEEIKFKGTDGIKIKADGNGVSENPFYPATVYVLPNGGITPTSTNDVTHLLWTLPFTGQFFYYEGLVKFDGTGNDGQDKAPLLISANGDHTQIALTGYPIEFRGGDATIRGKGNIDHQVIMGFFDQAKYNGAQGILIDNMGRFKINADGKQGKGGRVQIQTDHVTIQSMATNPDPEDLSDTKDFVVRANGDIADGGRVLVITSSISIDPETRAKVSADGAFAGTGNGDQVEAIYVNATGSPVPLGKSKGHLKLSSTGGLDGGNGGAIFVVAPAINAEDTGSVNASATAGNGNGGYIGMNTFSSPSTETSDKNVFKATGHGSGEGGKFEVLGIPVQFDLNLIVKIEGGDSLTSNGKDGNAKLNGIECQRYRVQSTYPKGYWNCANPSAPHPDGQFVLNAFANLGAIRADIESDETDPFIWTNSSDMDTFFAISSGSQLAGFTFRAPWQHANIYLNVFKEPFGSGAPSLSGTDIQSAAAHELGHAADYTASPVSPLQSETPSFVTWVDSDINYLDFTSPGVSRNPCTPFNGVPAPFENVYSERTGNLICNGTILDPAYAGLSNSQILAAASVVNLLVYGGDVKPWNEPYAQSFGYVVNDQSGQPFLYTWAEVMTNGYFECARAWTNAVNQKASVPPPAPAGFTCQ